MNEDIVDRLRREASTTWEQADSILLSEAADEIERLRRVREDMAAMQREYNDARRRAARDRDMA